MTKKFNFINVDTTVLPPLKRKNVNGHRYYEIGGAAYPSVTTILSLKKTEELKEWRSKVGEDVANWEMKRAASRGNSLHTLVEQYIKGFLFSWRARFRQIFCCKKCIYRYRIKIS